jgi:hypothetical protein
MSTEIRDAFYKYIDLAKNTIKKTGNLSKSKGVLRLYSNIDSQLRDLANLSTKSDEWRILENITSKEFYEELSYSEEFEHSLFNLVGAEYHFDETHHDEMSLAMFNYFCRSGFYNNVFAEKKINKRKLFEKYCASFQKKYTEITYLVALDGVSFDCPSMTFNDFTISKFSEAEISQLIERNTCKVFYRGYHFDSEQLKDYWYITVKENLPISFDGYTDPLDFYNEEIRSNNSDLSKKVEAALIYILLYPWDAKKDSLNSDIDSFFHSGNGNTHGMPRLFDTRKIFKIPFIIEVNDHLIDLPNAFTIHYQSRLTDKKQAERHQMVFVHKFDKKDAYSFFEFVRDTQILLDNLKEERDGTLKFINRALSYYVKAYFSDKLEELIWYIVTVEALIGKKSASTETINRRISNILGDSLEDKDSIKKRFNKIYDIRSQIIHGSDYKTDDLAKSLDDARKLAGDLIVWFLHYINYLKKNNMQEAMQDREKLLAYVDYVVSKEFPSGFPHIKAWIR